MQTLPLTSPHACPYNIQYTYLYTLHQVSAMLPYANGKTQHTRPNIIIQPHPHTAHNIPPQPHDPSPPPPTHPPTHSHAHFPRASSKLNFRESVTIKRIISNSFSGDEGDGAGEHADSLMETDLNELMEQVSSAAVSSEQ
jgi:hypothetical protein